jgi:putative transposase
MSFVSKQRDRFGVEPILRVLQVPTSTFYGWVAQHRDPCQRRRDDRALLGRIQAIHERSGGTYGAPRVHAQLRRDGTRVARKRVERLTLTAAPRAVHRDPLHPAAHRCWGAPLDGLGRRLL